MTAAGLVVAIVGLGLSHAAVDAASSSLAAWWVLLGGWLVFCLGAVHVVWPQRWSGIVAGAQGEQGSGAAIDPRRVPGSVRHDLEPR